MKYIIWTCPRSLSTLTERIVMNIGIKCIHEPFSVPYYFGPDKVSKRPSDPDVKLTYMEVFNDLKLTDNVFVKDMATHFYQSKIFENSEVIEEMKTWKHAFLIRNPDICIRSLFDMSHSEDTGWDYFDANECGYKDLYELHKTFGGPIFQSENLIKNDKQFIKDLCAFLDREYNDKYLIWGNLENNVPIDWELWKSWHVDAIRSTQIVKKETSFKPKENESKYIPIYNVIEENKKYYNELIIRS